MLLVGFRQAWLLDAADPQIICLDAASIVVPENKKKRGSPLGQEESGAKESSHEGRGIVKRCGMVFDHRRMILMNRRPHAGQTGTHGVALSILVGVYV
jgi:hypothetical protein